MQSMISCSDKILAINKQNIYYLKNILYILCLCFCCLTKSSSSLSPKSTGSALLTPHIFHMAHDRDVTRDVTSAQLSVSPHHAHFHSQPRTLRNACKSNDFVIGSIRGEWRSSMRVVRTCVTRVKSQAWPLTHLSTSIRLSTFPRND